jgi:peptidoglycan LD-endopeptidase CwlK
MAVLGKASIEKLSTVDTRLAGVCYKAIEIYDFTVIFGFRADEKQQELYEQGLSTKAAGKSLHNVRPSRAIDLAPWPVDWKDRERFYFLAGVIITTARELGVKLRWGGDWDGDKDFKDQTFFDLGHFEILD